MSVAQHAERILAAWNVADAAGFETELENALRSCRRSQPVSNLEHEQQELLESVVERLRSVRAAGEGTRREGKRTVPTNFGLNAGFALLQHLSHRAA